MARAAIITARGGSKRIPGKNIRPFLGKPILSYPIEAAKKSGLFSTVMVSTDSEEIADIAKSYGAEVPFLRSAKTSSDFATTADVIEEVLERYQALGQTFSEFVCLYPTAPFVSAERLTEAVQLLGEKGADAVVPVVRFSFPPQRGFVVRDGLLAYQSPAYQKARSQDLTPLYHDAGQFYLVRTKAFEEEHTVVPSRCVPLILPETQVQDIDNETDWEIAEIKYARLQKSGREQA